MDLSPTSARTEPVRGARRPAGRWASRLAGVTVAAALLVPANPAAAGDPPKSPAQKAAEAKAKQDDVRRQRAESAAKIDAMQATEEQLAAALADIDAELRAREGRYGDAKAAADAARQHAADLQAAIAQDEATIAGIEEKLRSRAVDTYMAPDPNADPTRIFKADHIDDEETRKVLAETVNGNARDIIDELHATRARLADEKAATEAALADADAKEKEAQAALADVQAMRDEQARVKSAFDQKLAAEEQHDRALQAADADLTATIQQAEAEQRQQEEAARQAAAARAAQARAAATPAASGSSGSGGTTTGPVNAPASVSRPASARGLVWPISGTVSQEFGHNGHPGIDIFAPLGTPIYAALGGTVIVAGWNNGGYGNLVVIEHGDGFSTAYAHQSQVLVSVGQQVSTGQLIGLEGSTGYSTGPHLHFECRVNGQVQNPRNYLP